MRISRYLTSAALASVLAAFLLGGCGTTPGSPVSGSSDSMAAVSSTTLPAVTETQVATRTTTPPSSAATRSLTFVGQVSQSLWQTLRTTVMQANGDGQAVLDRVAALSAGNPVSVGSQELDRFSGIGFSAGADSSQPIAVGQIPEDGEALIFAFTVTANPDAATIVGFQRGTGHVVLVDGPLPIDDATRNITTVPTIPSPSIAQ